MTRFRPPLSSADGMGTLARDGFEPALLRLVGDHLQDGSVTPVICCGMVGARQGWIEAAYQTVSVLATTGGAVRVAGV
ncbi:2-dehydro-3-deoxygalactonokinase [Sulfitobacter sp. S190]|uniref:2-dehydro-3-deoxygalactonokinase n=1 Tax=Sulfitobacter sp. S190 TaxID=2867022 RepID=UPI0021A7DBEA|nr:2-dehydro-3-deoxygalactonokinase [Sulfitobacter sp. S190]